MDNGRLICHQLKELRRDIAIENGISLQQEACTYTGQCDGTCPRCDAEVRYLEERLAQRLRLGKAATVAGLAIGLAVGANAQAQDSSTPSTGNRENVSISVQVVIRGTAINQFTKEPIANCKVKLYNGKKRVASTVTDSDGFFFLQQIEPGTYRLHIVANGYIVMNETVIVERRDILLRALMVPEDSKRNAIPLLERGPEAMDFVIGKVTMPAEERPEEPDTPEPVAPEDRVVIPDAGQ